MITFASVKIFYLLLYVYPEGHNRFIVSFSVSKRMHYTLKHICTTFLLILFFWVCLCCFFSGHFFVLKFVT